MIVKQWVSIKQLNKKDLNDEMPELQCKPGYDRQKRNRN